MSDSIVLNPGDARITRLLADIAKTLRVDPGRLTLRLQNSESEIDNPATTEQSILNDNDIILAPDDEVFATLFSGDAALDAWVSNPPPFNYTNNETTEIPDFSFQTPGTATEARPVEQQTELMTTNQNDRLAAVGISNSVTQYGQNLISNHTQNLSATGTLQQPTARKRARQKRTRASYPALQNTRQKRRKTCIQCEIDHKKCVPIDNGACERCRDFKTVVSWCCYDTPDGIELFRVATPEFRLIPELGLDQGILNRVQFPSQKASVSIIISQGFTNLTLDVYEFDKTRIPIAALPQRQKELYSVPFALKDIPGMENRMRRFVRESMPEYYDRIMSQSDKITACFFYQAYKVAFPVTEKSALLSKALFLWTAARMMEGGWCMCGEETLGLCRDKNHQVEIIEAPLIDYQFAGILRDRILIPFRDRLLKELQQKLYHERKENWLEITLTIFILLNSYGHYIQQQKDVAAGWEDCKTPYPCAKAFGQIFRGAAVLLTIWHKINGQRVFNRLKHDFDRVSQELQNNGVEESQIRMLLGQAKRIEKKKSEWGKLVETRDYGKEHWFTSQMFQENWKPIEPPFPMAGAQE